MNAYSLGHFPSERMLRTLVIRSGTPRRSAHEAHRIVPLMRRNDGKVIEAAARSSGVSPKTVFVDEDSGGGIIINHQESMKWVPEVRHAVEATVTRITGRRAFVT